MSDIELKYPEWQAPLQDLFLESDHEKRHEKIQKVETLIFERFSCSAKGNDGHSELQAINDAWSVLPSHSRITPPPPLEREEWRPQILCR